MANGLFPTSESTNLANLLIGRGEQEAQSELARRQPFAQQLTQLGPQIAQTITSEMEARRNAPLQTIELADKLMGMEYQRKQQRRGLRQQTGLDEATKFVRENMHTWTPDDLMQFDLDPAEQTRLTTLYGESTQRAKEQADAMIHLLPSMDKSARTGAMTKLAQTLRRTRVLGPDAIKSLSALDVMSPEFDEKMGSLSTMLLPMDEAKVVGKTLVNRFGNPIYTAPDPVVLQKGAALVSQSGQQLAYNPDLASQLSSQGRALYATEITELQGYGAAMQGLRRVEEKLVGTGQLGGTKEWQTMLPDWTTHAFGWGEDAKTMEAIIKEVRQAVGKAMEGGVLRKEDELKYREILPRQGDTLQTVRAKLAGLNRKMEEERYGRLQGMLWGGANVGHYLNAFRNPNIMMQAPAGPDGTPGEIRQVYLDDRERYEAAGATYLGEDAGIPGGRDFSSYFGGSMGATMGLPGGAPGYGQPDILGGGAYGMPPQGNAADPLGILGG